MPEESPAGDLDGLLRQYRSCPNDRREELTLRLLELAQSGAAVSPDFIPILENQVQMQDESRCNVDDACGPPEVVSWAAERGLAAQALGRLAELGVWDRGSVSCLIRYLQKDEHPEKVVAALKSLAAAGAAAVQDIVSPFEKILTEGAQIIAKGRFETWKGRQRWEAARQALLRLAENGLSAQPSLEAPKPFQDCPSPSPLERFKKSLASSYDGREEVESLDLDALRGLSGAERGQAKELLLSRIRSHDDGRVPPALAELGDPSVAPDLAQAADKHGGQFRVEAARALFRLGQPDPAARLLGESARSEDPAERRAAAASLRDIDLPALDELLLRALSDRHEAVRRSARGSLLARLGVPQGASGFSGTAGALFVRLEVEKESVRKAALTQATAALAAVRGGKTAKELGIESRTDSAPDALKEFTAALAPAMVKQPVDAARLGSALARLGPADAEWGRAVILYWTGQESL